MKSIQYILLFFLPISFLACGTAKDSFDPNKKYSSAKLKSDYKIFRNVLEESHPSLYWYTPKDSMNYFFDYGYAQIKDSMTEPQFKTLLSYVIAKIDCGHTSVKYSKQYTKYLDTAKLRTFPLALKFWPDTMVVTMNLNRRDSILRRGVVLTKINGLSPSQLTDTFFQYIVTDGYSMCGKYQSLSTGFAFANFYSNVFGLTDTFNIHYLDSAGSEKETAIPVYDFKADTMNRVGVTKEQLSGKRKKAPPHFAFFASSNLQLDTTGGNAFLTLNTFDRNNHLRKFFKKSFKALDENHIKNLVIDVRSNGGGDAGISTLLTRYLIDKKFKLADSLYAVTRKSKYDHYIEKSLLYNTMMFFVTTKKGDGKYHFGYYERHYFSPISKHHFNGEVYVLIGGNSFSATTLFVGALKGQKNVTVVGEETGGGYYGNTAWVIPDVVLPNTKLRFRLPRFRLVVDKNRDKDGHGVMPDVPAPPTVGAIKKGIDFKAEKVKDLIESGNSVSR
ncbi:MAG: peptidase S41 [Bacteroidetes bacterium]|nr:MAG: peptidase S41 [Bacteroidota bacterium]